MARYKLSSNGVQREDGASIPNDLSNRDWQEYQAWLSEGNTPDPADPPYQPTYQELRAREYPPVAEYLDGIVKANQGQIDMYIAACLAVKVKYPKPLK